jgi:hypothetical protein
MLEFINCSPRQICRIDVLASLSEVGLLFGDDYQKDGPIESKTKNPVRCGVFGSYGANSQHQTDNLLIFYSGRANTINKLTNYRRSGQRVTTGVAAGVTTCVAAGVTTGVAAGVACLAGS